MKILFVKRDKIGDMLLMTPMLRLLRQRMPGAEIHVLANTYNAWVLDGNPDVDRIWVYERVRGRNGFDVSAAWRQLKLMIAMRRERFDVAIAAGCIVSPRAIKRARLTGAHRTIAYCDAGQECGLSDAIPFRSGMHEVDGNYGLLAPLGIAPPEAPIYPVFALPGKWHAFAEAWLAEHGLVAGSFIVVGLNARKAARKPGAEQIIRWARHFKEHWGLDTVLMWQPGPKDDPVYPGDDDYVRPVLEAALPYLHPFADASSIMPALGIIWRAATSVFPDSGITHLAALSPGSVISLFTAAGPESGPSHWRPYAPCAGFLEASERVDAIPDEEFFSKVQATLACGRARAE